jgi:fused signal recognition particle receptor
MGLLDRFKKREAASEPVQPDSQDPESPATLGDSSEQAESSGLIGRLRRGVQKTRQLLSTDIRDLWKQEGQVLDDEFLDRLFAVLVRTDMGTAAANEIRDEIRGQYRGRVVEMEDLLEHIRRKLRVLTQQPSTPLRLAEHGPTVIIVVGVNGSGKTTSIAKLAHRCHSQGKKVLLGAGDTFRAAAVEQLSIWADRIGVEIVKGQTGADPASVAHRSVARSLEAGVDVCILDTAGRLQTQTNLMDELAKIRRVVSKQIPEAPHEVLLVLDATAGQNGISQAKGFGQAAECTGIILAKLDGTAKGGVVIPIRQQFDLPVKFIGVGEKLDDLAEFDSVSFVEALFAGL